MSSGSKTWYAAVMFLIFANHLSSRNVGGGEYGQTYSKERSS